MTNARQGLAALACCVLIVACGGGGGGGGTTPGPLGAGGSCGADREKQFVLDATRDWYLFLELLPATVDLAQYPTADDLLDALTAQARAQSKDRFFSYLTSIRAEEQFFGAGESVGFGIGTLIRETTRLFVSQVYESSAAADAGFLRGDEILAIGTSSGSLQPVSALLAQPNGLSDALGPSEAGVTRVFRVRTRAGQTLERTVTKRAFDLDPVPQWTLFTRAGLPPVGYVNLRTFIAPADAALREAFASFKAQNVFDVVVDLRYNGGGLVATAELLSHLLAADDANQTLYQTKLNARKAASEQTVPIRAVEQAIAAQSIAFLVTGASASASELVVNSLAPYASVAIVGARTYGKPVGQFAFDLSGCDTRLRLVTFKSVNREGYGDYFTGLPPEPPDQRFRHAFCAAADDLTRDQGDVAESMLADALYWLESGACPVTAAARRQGAALDALTAAASAVPPAPRRPAPDQVYLPGSW